MRHAEHPNWRTITLELGQRTIEGEQAGQETCGAARVAVAGIAPDLTTEHLLALLDIFKRSELLDRALVDELWAEIDRRFLEIERRPTATQASVVGDEITKED